MLKGQRTEIQHINDRCRCRTAFERRLGYGRKNETEIPPTGSDRSILIQHFTQLYGLIQQRARRARVAET